MKSLRVALEKVHSETLFKCPVCLIHVSEVGATSVFWRANSDGEAESGLFSSKE